MNKGLEALKRLKWGYAITREERIELCECIETELKDKENKLSIISEILVDISKGNYADLKVAIEEIREAL